MCEHTVVEKTVEPVPNAAKPAAEKPLTQCIEIVRRYELMRYNLYKEKYEKHVKLCSY